MRGVRTVLNLATFFGGCLAVCFCLFENCPSLRAQNISKDSVKPGAEMIEGTLSPNASGVQVQVNGNLANLQRVSLEDGKFSARLGHPLKSGDTVSVRQIVNGDAGPWTTPVDATASPANGQPPEAQPTTKDPPLTPPAARNASEGESSSVGNLAQPMASLGKASPAAPAPSQQSEGLAGGPMLRTIVGFEQAGVSAAQSQQDFFLDLLYDRPVAFRVDNDLGPALRLWGNLRVSSVPQQITTDVATFATNFAQQVGQLKVNEVAQAFEFLGGTDIRFWASRSNYESTDEQNDPGTQTRISTSFIFGGGVITPLSPKDSAQIFEVPSNQPGFFTQFPQTVGKEFVVFTLPDRNRFFRQAYGGFRIKTNFIGDKTADRYPETFDFTYGFNEAVTGGTIRGGVMRLEGFVPIPYAKASWIYLFGTGLFKPGGRATITNPFLLAAAPSGTLPTDPNAVIITTPQPDRDYYRVGIGIDFVNLIANWKNAIKK